MKQMRSRFRLISLLLVCAFVLTAALCCGSALRQAGIALPSLSSIPRIGEILPSVRPEDSASDPIPSNPLESVTPGDAISPEPEYNTFGL